MPAEVPDGHKDDETIGPAQRMLRRIHPDWITRGRPERSNFEVRKEGEGLSVTAWLSPQDLAEALVEAPTFGVVRVLASELRLAGFVIVRVPLPNNANHCECYGAPSKSQRKALAVGAAWVASPADHEPESYGSLESFA